MFTLALFALLQAPTEYAILQAEYARSDDRAPFVAALKTQDARLRRLALRAIGRLERPGFRDLVVPSLRSADSLERREAVAALAQMNAGFDFATLLSTETEPSVREVIYESMGRAKPAAANAESLLARGLVDATVTGRTGAARGLETLIRATIRTTKPQPETIAALRLAIRDNSTSPLRQFALLALNAAADQDEATIDLALKDPDPLVRRLGVIGGKRWVDDPSPIVRFDALRIAGTCDRAFAAVDDPSGHVVLAAVDLLGAQKCDATRIEALVEKGKTWRVRTRALVAFAKTAPEAAKARIGAFRDDPMWQTRVYAANAARVAGDEATLSTLAQDANPNVAAAGLTTVKESLDALTSDHSGLLLAAAAKLKGVPSLAPAAPRILAAVLRLTKTNRAVLRDARVKLIELLKEAGDPNTIRKLEPLLADRDPVVAALAAQVLTESSGKKVEAKTQRYVPEPFPSEAALRTLRGSRATVVMKEAGTFTVELLTEDAPATVAKFAELADRRAYNGLTFHRVVSNFVLQGGSPGADEYDALTNEFLRDEVGFASNARGTFGVSTRGRDTGDGQIFINLIDNWRLDHTYTVFARVTSGMDAVDRILEGDVIEKIDITRGPGR